MTDYISSSDNYWSENDFDDAPVNDFDEITIDQLESNLINTINSGEPFFIWGKERQNQKIMLDNEKQAHILNKIAILRDISIELCRLKADKIFSQQFIEFLVKEKKMEAEQYFERTLQTHNNLIAKLRNDRILDDARITDINLRHEAARAMINKVYAETYKISMSARKDESIVNLINKFVDAFQPGELSSLYQLFFAANLINADTSNLSDFDLRQLTKESLVRQFNAEAELKQASADSARADVELKLLTNMLTRRDGEL